MVLIIIGDNAAGKTTLSDYLEKEYGFLIVDMGNFVRMNYELYKKKDELLSEYAQRIVDTDEIVKINKEAVSYARKHCIPFIAFCGIRTLSAIRLITNEYSNVKIVKIECSLQNRRKRYFKQKKDNVRFDKRNAQEFIWMKQIYSNIQIDYIINNDSDKTIFLQKAKELIDSLINKERSS